MFIESKAREAELAANSLSSEVQKFREGSNGWYDGSPQSVDRRLAQCERVLRLASGHLAANPYAWNAHEIVTELQSDRHALGSLKEQLLTAGGNRQAPVHKTSDVLLTGAEKRWVTLEAPKFIRANRDCLDDWQGHEELTARAINHASRVTSAHPRSAEVTAAFVDTVMYEARKESRDR